MDLFVFGEIVKTRGLKGCLKALSYLESPEILDKLDTVFLESGTGRQSRHNIKKMDSAGKCFFLELEGISGLDEARALVGCKLLMPRDLLDVLPDGEYYWQDLIGLEAVTPDGLFLGHIEAIFPTGSNDVYVCRREGKEYFIPAIADIVVGIDLALRKMTVKLVEGLEQ